MWTYNYNNSPELYHHGVKGMKWGVRRDRLSVKIQKLESRRTDTKNKKV